VSDGSMSVSSEEYLNPKGSGVALSRFKLYLPINS
jgi:hypothetical protein